MNRCLYALLLVGLAGGLVRGAEAPAPAASAPRRVHQVSIVSSTTRPVSQALVRANLRLKEGELFDRALLNEDIRGLHETGHYVKVDCEVKLVGDDQVDLAYKITPEDVIVRVDFVGCERVKAKTLRKECLQKEGEMLNKALVAADLTALYKLYDDKGYGQTRISQEFLPGPDGKGLVLTYRIEERDRYKTREFQFQGNQAISTWKLKRLCETDVSWWGYIFPVGFFKDLELESDLDKMRQAFWDLGYLDVTAKSEVTYTGKKAIVHVTFVEGPQYHISEIRLSGNQKVGEEELRKVLTLTPGKTYSRKDESADLQALQAKYGQHGYLDCSIRLERHPDPDQQRVAIAYSIEEGKPSRIRDINISGNRITKDHVIRRELLIHPGDLSDGGKIKASRDRLMNLGYFKNVEIVDLSTKNESERDLDVKVDEDDTGRLMAGVGVSSADDAFFTAEFMQTNFDLANPWFFRGGGQRVRLRGMIGHDSRSVIFAFTEPWFLDRPLRLDYDLWRRETSSHRMWDETDIGTSVALTKKLPWDYWRQTAGYRIAGITVEDIDSSYSQAFRDKEEGHSQVSALTYSLNRTHLDSIQRPSYGNVFGLDSEIQGRALESYTNAYKLTLRGDQYLPILKETVFHVSSRISQVRSLDSSGDNVRVFDRFFAGGAYSLRGFKERSVGPVDPANEEPVGGQSMLLGSAEITTPIFEDVIYWAWWTDVGNVWAGDNDWDPGDLNVGAGAGLRFKVPIGAVIIDYGWPVHRTEDRYGRSGRLHFNLSASF